MPNDFYQDSGNPANNSQGDSSVIRAEFAAIEAAFDKLPALTGNGDKTCVINAGGTAITVKTAAEMRVLLDLEVGTDVQAWDYDLDAIAALAKADGNFIVGDGAAWVVESGATARTSLGLGTSAVKNTGTSGNNVPLLDGHNTWSKAQGTAQVALADGANIATDASLGNVFSVTLAGNRALDNPTNLIAGFTYIWNINQDATGGRTLAYGSLFKFPSAVTPVLSTAANAKDSLSCVYDGTILRCALTKAFG